MIEAGAFTLRPWQGDDTTFVFEACQDSDVARWTSVPQPYQPGHAADFVRVHARPQPESSGAWFAMTRTDTGELLGSISFNAFDRELGTGDIGYWLAADARGGGVASTCLDGLAGWGFSYLGLTEVRALIARGNVRSQRVAERAGFRADGVLADHCRDGERPDDAIVFLRRAPRR